MSSNPNKLVYWSLILAPWLALGAYVALDQYTEAKLDEELTHPRVKMITSINNFNKQCGDTRIIRHTLTYGETGAVHVELFKDDWDKCRKENIK